MPPLPLRTPDRAEIVGRKGSVYYRAHSYHTKVPPEGIARLIEHYTDPGDVVVDPFCGSGMTGVAALLTGRSAVLSDLSPAACHIAAGYANPAEPRAFKAAGETLLSQLEELENDLYGTRCPECLGPARVEYTVWSDVFACPDCSRELVFWQEAVDVDSGAIAKRIDCSCGSSLPKRSLDWLRSEPVLESISCRRCRRVERGLGHDERARVLAFDRSKIRAWYPSVPFESWREMWRGQHGVQGIETAADFFTPRNLRGLAETWRAVNDVRDEVLHHGLRFAFTSIVNRASRRYQWNPKRPTNVLGSTMYIASLSYEFNVFSLLRRKLATTFDLYRALEDAPGQAAVHQAPAQRLEHLSDASVHYVFTDPPFGSNIFYSDSSFLWEAWLGSFTDPTHEAVVHRSQRAEHGGKTLQDYEKLMAEAFAEMSRVLRPNGWASVMFHNSSDEVWSALTRAVESADFEIGAAVAFDKTQASFKGLKGRFAGERVPNFDLVLHLRRRTPGRPSTPEVSSDVARRMVENRLHDHVAQAPANRRSTAYLHSLAMRILLEEGLPLDGFGYAGVEALCEQLFAWDGRGWTTQVDTGTEA
jgi:DNA modification methylase/predicted subunit of tRNA(5-methylaminomethyl-2-thiouridylate) methyltransferase